MKFLRTCMTKPVASRYFFNVHTLFVVMPNIMNTLVALDHLIEWIWSQARAVHKVQWRSFGHGAALVIGKALRAACVQNTGLNELSDWCRLKIEGVLPGGMRPVCCWDSGWPVYWGLRRPVSCRDSGWERVGWSATSLLFARRRSKYARDDLGHLDTQTRIFRGGPNFSQILVCPDQNFTRIKIFVTAPGNFPFPYI